MTIGLKHFRSRAAKRADSFATAHFGRCREHMREAVAVHRRLERLCGGSIDDLDPEKTIGEIVPASQVEGAGRLAEHQTLGHALGQHEIMTLAAGEFTAENIVRALLGSTAKRSSWDPLTIWSRSVRGLINERVMHAGGCSCGEGGAVQHTA